jgi:UDP-N-acetylmuramate: L-alanyl-gamma-D-glutamyl-meso-diaminopimelate ligase
MNSKNLTPKPAPLLSPSLNTLPPVIRHIHLMGICGTGMASLAGMLKQRGYHISGSDQNVYPPMSLFLKKLSIPVMPTYSAHNLDPRPDLVIVGNVITRENPEAVALSHRRIPYVSMPQALKAFAFEGKKSIVISGTHGKTTTSALVCWILENAGMDPSFMVGGVPGNFQGGFKIGQGPYFVIEGDEYDTAFFDKGPKFLHYSPWVVILTSIEFDHADIYRNLDHVTDSFRNLIQLIPRRGLLIANGDDPAVVAQSQRAPCPVITYGFGEGLHLRAVHMTAEEKGTRLTARHARGETRVFNSPLYGRHNISNLLSTLCLSEFLGIERTTLEKALPTFKGVKRRQEIIGEQNGVLAVDDFAHHPTAVRETVHAVKERYRGRRLIAVFEPRSNSSRRNIFQKAYAGSFGGADLVMVPEPILTENIPPEQRFSSAKLAEDLKNQGIEAFSFPNTGRLFEDLAARTRPGDVVLFMSNGAFDHLPQRFLDGMRQRPRH